MRVDLKGAKTAYRPGERFDFSGVNVFEEDVDVTEACTFSVEGDLTSFPADAKTVTVTIEHRDETETFELRRKRSLLPLVLGAIAVVGIAVGVYFATRPPEMEQFPEGDTGAYMIPQGDMTDDEYG